jgi:hypothetical protein
MRVSSKLLVFGRTTIHFCFCHQVDWQEYSEFRKSALLALSASAISKTGQLGIFRNSEYRNSVNGILSVSCLGGGSVGVLVLKTPVKAGCLAAVKTAQKGDEPKPAAVRSELLRSVFLIFWGQKNELSIDR